jgi:hypothetical protein
VNASPASGGSPWSPQQRRWLQALGHVVYRAGGDAEEPASAETATKAEASPGRSAGNPMQRPLPPEQPRPAHDAHATPRHAPEAPVVVAPAAGSGSAVQAAPRRAARLPDRLQLAMLRASGLDPADTAAQAAMAQWPVEKLRGDAAAKRAFWPQLRALRRRP